MTANATLIFVDLKMSITLKNNIIIEFMLGPLDKPRQINVSLKIRKLY